MAKSRKERLDVLVVERGLAEGLDPARRLVRAGQVRVDGQVADQPGARVGIEAEITLQDRPPYASRAGEKLAAALARFGVDVRGAPVADVGASTGGFTDCLLQRGARRVYAIDVGYGLLAWPLRNDPRVTVMERTNVRHLARLPELVDLVTVDVSFISLRLVLPVVVGWFAPGAGRVVALIKPQFEAARDEVEKGGVVRDPAVHRAVLERVLGAARETGLGLAGLMRSPLRGPAGNVEFLAYWRNGEEGMDPGAAVAGCVEMG